MGSTSQFPSPEEGLRLHLRLLDLEADASADVCRAYLPALTAFVEGAFGRTDSHLAQDAAEDALLSYVKNPGSFKPTELDLGAFLRMSAKCDALNLISKKRRQQRVPTARVFVDESGEGGNLSLDNPAALVEEAESAENVQRHFERITEHWPNEERRVFSLMLEDVRSTGRFAEALGLTHLPTLDQEHAVKRVKDRIKKRLERMRSIHG